MKTIVKIVTREERRKELMCSFCGKNLKSIGDMCQECNDALYQKEWVLTPFVCGE